MDFDIKRCTRRCALTARELQPGESFYSVLVPSGADVIRQDFCEEAWTTPPDDSIGWWKSQMPDPSVKKIDWAPSDVILDYFKQLQAKPDAADTRYVLCLLMIRRRMLRLEETETDESGGEVMVVYSSKDDAEFRVIVTDPTPERVIVIQDQLENLLFGEVSSRKTTVGKVTE